MKKLSLVSVSIVTILCSCQHDPPPPVPPPVVVLNQPASGAYSNGDTIFINADLSDEEALHEAFVCIRDSVDTMFSFDPYVLELTSYNVDTFWVVNGISAFSPGFVSVTAENHHELITTINRQIALNP
jgi:hypothetical protein